MKHSKYNIIHLLEKNKKTDLPKGQKLFNTLIKKIDKKRKLLEAWISALPLYQQKRASEFDPLKRTYDAIKTEFTYLLDKAYSSKIFTVNERKKLKNLICNIAGDLIIETNNEELKKIYNKYSKVDFDTEMESEKEQIKYFFEDMFGIDVDDDIDLSSPEKTMEQLAKKMQQKTEQEMQREVENQRQKKTSKKTAKAIAREAKEQEEAQNISKSIIEVYRKLASALHPDREKDVAEKDRKTELMSRVNVAYKNKDLLQLLELQLEIEQIDQSMINTMSEERLRHYNKILAEQFEELKHEIMGIELSFRLRFKIDDETTVSPTTILKGLQADIIVIEENIMNIKSDLALFQDIENIKTWLKYEIIPMQ